MFKDTYKTIDSLMSLPRLKALNINLNEEEQVDYIMKQLPDLEYLNDLEVERDSEEEEEEDEDEEEIQLNHEEEVSYDSSQQRQTAGFPGGKHQVLDVDDEEVNEQEHETPLDNR